MSDRDRTEPGDPKPCFPEWLVRRDPFLAAAETNGLFQAFLVRRRAARFRMPKFDGGGADDGTPDMLPWLAGFLVPLMIVATIVMFFTLGCIGLLIGSFLTIALQIYRKRRVDRRIALPRWIDGVLGSSLHRRALLDLATTPATPSEYAEALLLENRYRNWRFGSICWIIVAIAVMALYIAVRLILASGGLTVGDYVLLLAMLVVMIAALPFVYWMGARNAAREVAGRMHELFTLSTLELAGKRALTGLLVMMGVTLLSVGWLVALVLGAVLFVKLVIAPINHATGWLNLRGMLGEIIAGHLQQSVPQLIVGVLLIGLAFLLAMLGRWAKQSWERNRRDAMRKAEYAIPFVQAFLAGDEVEMERLRLSHLRRIHPPKEVGPPSCTEMLRNESPSSAEKGADAT
ncbi:hypothetical protein KQI84_01200 [bacterium]|nr:hypothetical protein [bacterium]